MTTPEGGGYVPEGARQIDIPGAGKRLFFVHQSLWDAMEQWFERRGFQLVRLPDGADDNGVPYYIDDDPDVVPTYGAMIKDLPPTPGT